MASDNLAQEIRERIRLDELIGQHVALRRSGRTFKGLCPFHTEKTPSFTVDPERGFWRCFGCGARGDVFDFVEQVEKITFSEAMERLARQLGLTYQRRGESREQRSERDRLYEVNGLAHRFFREELGRSREAQEYLLRRGLDAETIESFGIGYAPAGWEALLGHLSRQRADMDAARRAGLVRDGGRGPHDYFSDRIIFPIRDVQGRAIGFGGRALAADAVPKYLNTPETPVFVKGKVWYGLDRARAAISEAKQAIAVEGYMDLVALHQAGITNSVANLGTAITADHVSILRRYAEELVLAYDGDSAGVTAALRSAALFEQAQCDVRVAELPPGEDPDTLVKGQGAAAFRDLVARAQPLLDFRLKLVRQRYNLSDRAQRLAMVREAARIIAESRSHVVRQEYVGRLMDLLQRVLPLETVAIAPDEQAALLSEIRRIALGGAASRGQARLGGPPGGSGASPNGRPANRSPVGPGDETAPAAGSESGAPRGLVVAEQGVLRAVLCDPERWAMTLAERLGPDHFSDPECHSVAEAILGNNKDEAVARSVAAACEPALAKEVSRLLVVPDETEAGEHFEGYLATIELHWKKRRFEELKLEVTAGTVAVTDQRWHEFQQLAKDLAKGEG